MRVKAYTHTEKQINTHATHTYTQTYTGIHIQSKRIHKKGKTFALKLLNFEERLHGFDW